MGRPHHAIVSTHASDYLRRFSSRIYLYQAPFKPKTTVAGENLVLRKQLGLFTER
jgi:hypothetical protein